MLFRAFIEGDLRVTSTKRGAKGEMETIAEQATRNCVNARSRQNREKDKAIELLDIQIMNECLDDNKILILNADDLNVSTNLTGLIANQLMAKYQRPVLLLNKTADGWEGSGRGYDKSKFDNLRQFLQNSGMVMYAEGHANALGVGIYDKVFSEFVEYSNKALASFDFSPCYKVDFIFNGNDFRGKDIVEIAELKSLWGQGVDEPLVAIEHINIHNGNVVLMSPDKSPTLKITLPNGTSLIKFKSSQEEYEKLPSETGCITINVVGKCERNIWNGIVSPQIIVEDYEVSGYIKYYF